MIYRTGAFGRGKKNTKGRAESAKRIVQKRKGGNSFNPKYIAIKFVPHTKTVTNAKKRCFGVKFIEVLIICTK